jgi:hypothetical protein
VLSYYKVTTDPDGNVTRVLQHHMNLIVKTLKRPLLPMEQCAANTPASDVYAEEEQEVSAHAILAYALLMHTIYQINGAKFILKLVRDRS